MTENKGQGTTEAQVTIPEVEKPKDEKATDDTVSIRKGEYTGLKTQIKQLTKQLEEIAGRQAAEDAEKLKAAQNWEALEKKKNAEIETTKSELEKMRVSVLRERARSALLAAGMTRSLAVDGALANLPADIEADGISAWLEDVKKNHPEDFAAPVVPIGASSVGPVVKPTTDTKASIVAEWKAALPKGPAALKAVKTKVDAYMNSHNGENPLA